MYLIERIIGQLCYCLCLIIIFIKIYNGNYKSLKKVLRTYIILLAIMAFLFVPPQGADLYGSKDIIYLFKNSILNSPTPIAILYYYLFGKIGINGLLPCITSIIVYSNLFYIIYDYSKNNNIDKKAIATSIFFIMSCGFFMEVISGIRTMLAFSILARCFYNEMYNNKKFIGNIMYYIISIFIHSSAVGILLIRFVYYFIYENKRKIITKFFYLIVIIIFYIIFKKYILMSLDKFESYTQEGGYFWIWELIKILIMNFSMIIMLLKEENNKRIYLNLIIITFSTIMIILGEFNTFLRFSYFSVFIIMPIALKYFSNFYSKQKESNYEKINIMLLLSLIMLLLSCSRGNLSSLKFFILKGGM